MTKCSERSKWQVHMMKKLQVMKRYMWVIKRTSVHVSNKEDIKTDPPLPSFGRRQTPRASLAVLMKNVP